VPRLKQVQNFISYERRKIGQAEPVTIENVQCYADEHKELPGDENKAFVVDFKRDIERVGCKEEQRFVLVWSTKKLMRLQRHSRSIQLDGTYKLLWHGFPVLVSLLILF
jgi:hypothetical protein